MTRDRSALTWGLVLFGMIPGALLFIVIVPTLAVESLASGLPGTDPETLWSVAHPGRATILAVLGYAGGLLAVGLPVAKLALLARTALRGGHRARG